VALHWASCSNSAAKSVAPANGTANIKQSIEIVLIPMEFNFDKALSFLYARICSIVFRRLRA
jgi:hypothetical protein